MNVFIQHYSDDLFACLQIIQEFSNLDLHCPVPGCSPAYKRQLLHEGALKLRDSYTKVTVDSCQHLHFVIIPALFEEKAGIM